MRAGVGLPGGASGKKHTCQCKRLKRHWFDPWVRKIWRDMATHSSILAWRILWTEEPGELQSMGLQRKYDYGPVAWMSSKNLFKM